MTYEDLIIFLKKAVIQVDDKTAVLAKQFYPIWKADIEITQEMINEGKNRYQCDGLLWECIQPHTTQENWRPGIAKAAIWTAINEEHAGTIEDPIPVPEQLVSFEYEWGKYYSESGTLYLCDRQGGKNGDTYTLSYKPSALIGQYFSVVEA